MTIWILETQNWASRTYTKFFNYPCVEAHYGDTIRVFCTDAKNWPYFAAKNIEAIRLEAIASDDGIRWY